ncbi:MAG: hypothetical protein ACYDAC_12485 [Candidatus Dormibacteria bacterium]
MNALAAVHQRLGVAVLIVAVVAALLVIAAAARPHLMPTVRAFVRLCAAAAGIQVAVGLLLLAVGDRPAQAIHLFYGAATVVSIPAAAALGRRARGREELFYLLGGVVVMALMAFRAIATGSS